MMQMKADAKLMDLIDEVQKEGVKVEVCAHACVRGGGPSSCSAHYRQILRFSGVE